MGSESDRCVFGADRVGSGVQTPPRAKRTGLLDSIGEGARLCWSLREDGAPEWGARRECVRRFGGFAARTEGPFCATRERSCFVRRVVARAGRRKRNGVRMHVYEVENGVLLDCIVGIHATTFPAN